ncbi:MAG: tetratricopeptide repeat protein [Symploca sp. SIO3E6]|nr:tetratricopeptide repeat protein [Caldora sp. SIO3E6]
MPSAPAKLIASYDRALELKPDKHGAWYNRGIALYKLERYEEAIASYDRALEFNPDYDGIWNNRGIALKDLGRYEEAIASYDQAIELNPDDNTARYNKACCFPTDVKNSMKIPLANYE